MRVLSLISGGIDSAVSTGVALEKGCEVIAVHFYASPFADEQSKEKSKKILRILGEKFGKRIKFIVVKHGEAQKEIADKCDRKYTCVLCRRQMLRTASEIAKKEGCDALITGESLGQVASQTLPNLSAEHNAASIVVLRPLLGLDKAEIEQTARRYGTFESSIEPGGCCLLVPEKPVTKALKEKVEEEERKLDLKGMVQKSLESVGEEEI